MLNPHEQMQQQIYMANRRQEDRVDADAGEPQVMACGNDAGLADYDSEIAGVLQVTQDVQNSDGQFEQRVALNRAATRLSPVPSPEPQPLTKRQKTAARKRKQTAAAVRNLVDDIAGYSVDSNSEYNDDGSDDSDDMSDALVDDAEDDREDDDDDGGGDDNDDDDDDDDEHISKDASFHKSVMIRVSFTGM